MVHTWVTVNSSSSKTLHKSAVLRVSERSSSKSRVASSRQWATLKIAFALLAALILFSGFAIMHTVASSGQPAPATAEELVVSVDSGDTLWALAKLHKNPALDTRQAVQSIADRNGLRTAELRTGQQLVIPADIRP